MHVKLNVVVSVEKMVELTKNILVKRDLQNFILLVRTVTFFRIIIFVSSYTAKNNYFLLYELIQDLP